MLVTIDGDARLLEVDATGDVPTATLLPDRLEVPDGGTAFDWWWGEDDRTLVLLSYHGANDLGRIWHIDLATGRASEVAEAPGVYELRLSPDGTRVSYTSDWSEGAELWRLTIGGLEGLARAGRR